jgi:hypothetical protein
MKPGQQKITEFVYPMVGVKKEAHWTNRMKERILGGGETGENLLVISGEATLVGTLVVEKNLTRAGATPEVGMEHLKILLVHQTIVHGSPPQIGNLQPLMSKVHATIKGDAVTTQTSIIKAGAKGSINKKGTGGLMTVII